MDEKTIDRKQFEELKEKINVIFDYIQRRETKLSDAEPEEEAWLDSYEVCHILHISAKTLWRWRRDKLITYSKIRGECYYLPSEINKSIKSKLIKCEPKFVEAFRQNYISDAKYRCYS